MRNEKSKITKDVEFLEKAFKKWTPNILTSPYIPTPSILVKHPEIFKKSIKETIVDNKSPITKPSNYKNRKKYEKIINWLHKGAYAYSVGDYGTAINYFTRLLETDWLKHSSYFYLVKTLIKLDIEKEILAIQGQFKSNTIRMTKSNFKIKNQY